MLSINLRNRSEFMEEKKKYNPLSMLSDAHLCEDMSCCSDTYLLDRSTMTYEPIEEVAKKESEKGAEEK